MKSFAKNLLALGLAAAAAVSAAPASPANPLLLSLAPASPALEEREEVYPAMTAEMLAGEWTGSLPVKVGQTPSSVLIVQDGAVLNFDPSRQTPLLLALESLDSVYQPPRGWSIENGELVFSIGDNPWMATVRLHFYDSDTLTGAYTQYGLERGLTLWRSSYSPRQDLQTAYVFEGKTGQEWLNNLATYPAYTESASPIPFSYDLMNWERGESIASAYRLDQLMTTTRGYSDIERMKAILDLVCNNFKHDGAVPFPQSGLDPQQAMDYCLANGAIECRGLSAILSEFLRLCNIPAKPVMCIPSLEPSEDCHVVVQAYSYELGRWVLLDPTYHLMLRAPDGTWANLEMLRQALIDGAVLIPNEDAGHNGMPFSIDYYRAYMAKNTFRFSCPTKFSFDERTTGTADNRLHMLTPEGWTVPYSWSRPEILTTRADDFWCPPPPRFDWDEKIPFSTGEANRNEADCFLLDGVLYVNAEDILWVSGQMVRKGEPVGTIQHNAPEGIAQDGDATVLLKGTQVYRFLGNDNIRIVARDGKYVRYLRKIY